MACSVYVDLQPSLRGDLRGICMTALYASSQEAKSDEGGDFLLHKDIYRL